MELKRKIRAQLKVSNGTRPLPADFPQGSKWWLNQFKDLRVAADYGLNDQNTEKMAVTDLSHYGHQNCVQLIASTPCHVTTETFWNV